MTAVLDVLPTAYRSAARRVGGGTATLIRLCAAQLADALAATGGMAGSDDCGSAWGSSYDNAVGDAFAAVTDAYNAAQVVGDLLDQTAANYAGAEAASAGGVIVGREFRAELVGSLGSAPRSVGQGGVDLPAGWGLVQAFIRRTWPNGHQDRLHNAGDAWHRAGNELLELLCELDDAAIALREQRAPEVEPAAVVVDSLRDQVIAVGNACVQIGDACHGYAHNLDQAHHKIIQALEQLLHDTAETAVLGTLLAVVTAGAGAIAAGVSEATAIRNAAAAVATIIDTLLAAATTVAADADLAAVRIGDAAAAIRPMLARTVRQAELVQSRIRNDGLIIGRVLPAADATSLVSSTTVHARALETLQLEAEGLATGASDGMLSVSDIYADPVRVLSGKRPEEISAALGRHDGWRVETLGRGGHKSQGWLLRQYNERGLPTGPQIRWHPGGGHHGPQPYWRVIGPNGDLYGEIR